MGIRPLAYRLFGNASVYGTGVVVTRFGFFLLLPFIWTKLESEDLGRIAIAQVVSSFVGPVLTLNLYDAVQRSYFEWDESVRRQNLWTIWILTVIFGLAFVSILDAFGTMLLPLVVTQIPYSPVARMVLWTTLFSNWTLIPLTLYRLREEARRYAALTVAAFCTMACFVLILVYAFDLGLMGYLSGMLANAVLWFVIHSYLLLGQATLRFRRECVYPALAYSMPTVPASILDSSGGIFDRYFLDKHVALAAIGHYSISFQVASVLGTINSALKSSWLPLVFRMPEREDGRYQLGRLGTIYVGMLAIFALGLASLSEDVIALILPKEMQSAARWVPLFVLAQFMMGITTGIGRGLDLAKRNDLTLVISVVGFAASFSAMAWLVPEFGIPGAIAGILIATATRSLLQIGLATLIYPRPIFLATHFKVLVACLLGYWASTTIATDHLLLKFLLKLPLLAASSVAVVVAVVGFKSPMVLARQWFSAKFD